MADPVPARRALLPLGTLGRAELLLLTTTLMALNALAIDIMLPALGVIARDLNVQSANDQQLVVVAYLMGFGVPQLFWGPLSERFGRRPTVVVALLGFSLAGAVAGAWSSFEALLALRFVQGVFAAGARVVAVAIVRDQYSGSEMARMMAFIMSIFVVVPITAPMLGQAVLAFASWRAIFTVLAVLGGAAALHTLLRLPETHPAKQPGSDLAQGSLRLGTILAGYRRVLMTRSSRGYILAGAFIYGTFYSFLSSSEQLFREVFHQEDTFVFWFAGLASGMSLANMMNARLVRRVGMRRLSHGALVGLIVLASTLLGLTLAGFTSLAVFYPIFFLIIGHFGVLGSNFNALAMEPLRDIAGLGSATFGFATVTLSSFLAGFVGRAYDGSTVPLLTGYVVLGLCALAVVTWTERGRLFGPDPLHP